MHPARNLQPELQRWEDEGGKTSSPVAMYGAAPTSAFHESTVGDSSPKAEQHMSKNTRKYRGAMARLGVVAAVALGTACASAPPAPPASLQAAQQAITTAESADAGHSAPGELAEARSKLTQANVAVKDGETTRANRLALQARANADLATAKTASIKARAVNAEMTSGNAALVEELDRNTGDSK